MLLVAGDDLVAGPQVEAGQNGVDAVGRRSGQGDVDGLAAEHAGVAGAQVRRQLPMTDSM